MNKAKIIYKIAREEILVRKLLAMEFDTKEELKQYLEDHPDADKSKHHVKQQTQEKTKSDDKNINMALHKKGMKKVINKVKDWSDKEKSFFNGGELPSSEERKSIGNFMKRKAKGIVKHLKHEVDEWKSAGIAVKKLAKREKLSDHEKKALKTVATHAALTAGTMAVTGGLSFPITSLIKHFGLHMLEHSILVGAAKVSLFASDMSEEQALELMVNQMADVMENQYFSPEEWEEAVEFANTDRQMKDLLD